METLWKKRTNKGRVVYNRKKHGFTMRDLERISRKVEEAITEEEEEDLTPFLRVWRRLVLKVGEWIVPERIYDDFYFLVDSFFELLVDIKDRGDTRFFTLYTEYLERNLAHLDDEYVQPILEHFKREEIDAPKKTKR